MATRAIGGSLPSVTYIDITRACRVHRIAQTTFGRRALNDPRLIQDMENGRELRPATAERVRQLLIALEG